MKYKKWIYLALVVVFSMTFIFVRDNQGDRESDKVEDNKKLDEINERVENVMDSMTIEEKIGQMLIINYGSDAFDDKFKEFFSEVQPGGIILTKENITTFDKTLNLVNELKSASKYSLIVSVDQEGGRVQRLKFLTDAIPTDIPDMYSLGKTGDKSLAYQVGKLVAEEMRTLGINVVYAPVVDIFSNPDNTVIGNRSFGNDKNTVINMALSLAEGLEDNGIIATFKHFPGHGDTGVDSHVKLPVINKTYEEVKKLELVPFTEAIKNGAKIIMTGHIAFPEITGDMTPASLSKALVNDILRDKLGYKGLIITDAINMKALTDNYSYEEIVLKSIEAGNDLILIPKDEVYTINFIKSNVSEDRINESVKRILAFKYKYLDNYEYTDRSVLGSEEHMKVISKIK